MIQQERWLNYDEMHISGQFDPVTEGHLNIINRLTKVFDEVYVAVLNNSDKQYMFKLDTRMKFIRDSIDEYVDDDKKVKIICSDGLLVRLAEEYKIKTIVRGIRNSQSLYMNNKWI